MPFWAGYRVQSYAELYPALWDVDSAFGAVGGSVAAYVPFGQRLSLAGRVGGRLVLGTYPWHDSAFLGGGDTLRSYSLQRYAGDGSVYGNFEARVNLGSVTLLVPGHLGLFALTDVGRVFFEGEDSNQWHAAGGGGVFFSVLNLRSVFHVAIAGGSDGTGVYADYGFSF